MRFCVADGLLQVVERQGVSLLRASSAQRLVPTRVRQACWEWCQLVSTVRQMEENSRGTAGCPAGQ